MKAIWIAKRAFKNLWHAKTRTILTSLAIAVSTFALALSVAAGEGVRQYANGLLAEQVDTKALLVSKDTRALEISNPALAEPREYDPKDYKNIYGTLRLLDSNDIERIKSIDGIDKISLFFPTATTYVMTQGSKKYNAGVREYSENRKTRVIAGAVPPFGQPIGYNDVVLPESFLTELGFSTPDSAIGEYVTVRFDRLKKKW